MSEPLRTEPLPERLSGWFRSQQLDELRARDLMTPGVTAISDAASLEDGMRAIVAHRRHAILVCGAASGQPLGWATDRGMLAQLERDAPLILIGEVITEDPVSVAPDTTAREVVSLLSEGGPSQVLVASAGGAVPEGVISAFDLIRSAGW